MSNKYGADVDQLRALAKAFSHASDRLENDRLSVGNQIKISAWVGPFAARFRLQWESEHSKRVSTAARSLADTAAQLRRNADEQERASAADGGAQARTPASGETHGTGGKGSTAPMTTAGYVRNLSEMTDSEDGIRVQKILGEGDKVRFIVYIDGSGSAANGRLSWGNNVGAVFSLDSNTLSGIREDVQRQMSEMGSSPDDEVMLVGFSQGGMIAQTLADDGSFNTKEVLTYGSPTILDYRNFGGANVVHLRHNNDIVPLAELVARTPVGIVTAAVMDLATGAVTPEKGEEVNFKRGSYLTVNPHNQDDYAWVAGEFDASTDPADLRAKANYQRFQGTLLADYR